eukprot:TRINITY_DN397_c0_g1_i10.p1 TRINITY_DN397_c0_g1~~TRINITY_DN397_c0_g1_i10.p1  ORF type:complete len:257 (+),score=99.56 TRINITY_DN397_c0_g1_i10:90-860(+)
MIRRPPRSTLSSSSAASDVYKRQGINAEYGVQTSNMDAAALNTHLVDKSYIGGYVPTQQDVTEFNALAAAPDAKKFPNAARWYAHIASFNVAVRASLPGAASGVAPVAKAKAAAADDFDDLFGDDEEEEEVTETPQEMAARKKKEAEAKKKKAAPVGKSTIVFDVKPACFDGDDDDEDGGGTIDLEDLVKFVKGIQMEGLVWGEKHQFAEIGYGIKKLQVQCTVVDDLVGVDDLTEQIQDNEDLVQSCDVVAFNKV